MLLEAETLRQAGGSTRESMCNVTTLGSFGKKTLQDLGGTGVRACKNLFLSHRGLKHQHLGEGFAFGWLPRVCPSVEFFETSLCTS